VTIIRILLILIALNRVAIPQELFDPYQVHILEISFYNPDYDQILQERWEVDDKTYELATVVFNGDTLDSVGVHQKVEFPL
jgi:spore coat protein CotH